MDFLISSPFTSTSSSLQTLHTTARSVCHSQETQPCYSRTLGHLTDFTCPDSALLSSHFARMTDFAPRQIHIAPFLFSLVTCFFSILVERPSCFPPNKTPAASTEETVELTSFFSLYRSQRLSERIPVTLWFPFCGGQNAGVKKKKREAVVGVGRVAAASQCLPVLLVGEAERQQQQRRRSRRLPPPPGFPAAPPSDRTSTAWLVIEGAHSRRCTPLSSLPLRAAQFSAFCSLSWLETGEYGVKC